MTVTIRTYRPPTWRRRLVVAARELAWGMALGTVFAATMVAAMVAGGVLTR